LEVTNAIKEEQETRKQRWLDKHDLFDHKSFVFYKKNQRPNVIYYKFGAETVQHIGLVFNILHGEVIRLEGITHSVDETIYHGNLDNFCFTPKMTAFELRFIAAVTIDFNGAYDAAAVIVPT
jgi:hypothetical protein